MTEYWKSNAKKFCDACKCWISDNKSSIGFHESGKKHQFNVEKRLSEIRSRGAANDRIKQKEDNWIEQMERAAMKDYKAKDLGHGADITARVFNEEKAERDKQKQIIEEAAAKAKEKIQLQKQQEQLEAANEAAAQYAEAQASSASSGNLLRKMEAPKSGTKWHKDPPSSTTTSGSSGDTTTNSSKGGGKKWFEAISEDNQATYFWHIETHESRWDPPPEGYLSIKDQELINAKHEEKEKKKVEAIYEAQSIHGSHQTEEDQDAASGSKSYGPGARPSPYGAWKTVEKPIQINIGNVDLQTPQVRDTRPNPVPSHGGERNKIKFGERATPSLARAGIFAGNQNSEFSFKKRKIDDSKKKNIRRRNEED